jgi:hypothetical protein
MGRFFLSRLRERKGPAAEGGGKVRVFFLLLSRRTLGRRKKTLTQPSPAGGRGLRA